MNTGISMYQCKYKQVVKTWKPTTLRNQQSQTDKIIPNNKPDVIIRDNKNGTFLLNSTPISEDVIKKEAQNIYDIKTSQCKHSLCEI
jgi:hypothetical protein